MSGIRRRAFLAGGGLLFGLTAASTRAGPAPRLPKQPELQNRALVRVIGNTGNQQSFWRGDSTIYAYTPDGTLPLLKTVSGERSWWRRDGENHLRYSASITRFLDPVTGEPVERFVNPFTQRALMLESRVMRRQGGELFTPNGSYFRLSRSRFPDMYDDAPLQLDWTASDSLLRISRIEKFAPVIKRSMYEVRTYFAPVEEALDEETSSSAAASSGWFTSSYSPWLDMAEVPGHMIWHFESVKVPSLDDFGDEFLSWARAKEPRFDQSPEHDKGPGYIDKVSADQE
jgi:hypothetical protein